VTWLNFVSMAARKTIRIVLLALLSHTLACVDEAGPLDTGIVGETDTDDPVDADEDGYDESNDCDDQDPAVHPGTDETCNGVDDNCDGEVDEGVTLVAFVDADGDGFGGDMSVDVCALGDGLAQTSDDCDDQDPFVYPGAPDPSGDDVDSDCDGLHACDGAQPFPGSIAEGFPVPDYFCDNWNAIEGDLILEHYDVDSIEHLSCLCEVGGSVRLIEMTQADLTGLNALERIGGDFEIDAYPDGIWSGLGSLAGLDSLQVVEGDMTLDHRVHDLSVPTPLREIGGSLLIDVDDIETGLESFSWLERIGGSLLIVGPASADGLESLVEIGGAFGLPNYDTPHDITGLTNLRTIGGDVLLRSPHSLDGLDELETIGGDLVLDSQMVSSVAPLAALESIGGDLFIGAAGFESLTGMSSLASIGGKLEFSHDQNQLTHPGELPSLTYIGGSLVIGDIPTFTSLDGLEALTYLGGDFGITDNAYIESIDALSQVETIGHHFIIINNNHVVMPITVVALESLTYVGGDLRIDDYASNSPGLSELSLPALETVEGSFRLQTRASLASLTSLTHAGSLHLNDTGGWTDLQGLNNLTTVGSALYIYSSLQLASLSGLDSLTSVGHLSIGVDLLVDLDGLFSLEGVTGNLNINTHPELLDITGLSQLTAVGGELMLWENQKLSNLDGLDNLVTVGGDLRIDGNPLLTDFTALQSLTDVGGAVLIVGNGQLQSFAGFESLDTVGLQLLIQANNSLTDVTALNGVTSIGSSLQILDNDSLPTAAAQALADAIGAENVGGSVIINGNAP
jgi:hypothetical protein